MIGNISRRLARGTMAQQIVLALILAGWLGGCAEEAAVQARRHLGQRVSAAGQDSWFVKNDGTLWHWGLGNPQPVQMGNDRDWVSITAGFSHAHALKADGTLWSWGNHSGGALGLGGVNWTTEFTQVGTDSDWAVVRAAWQSSLGLKTDGSLWAWGWNLSGRLGVGDANDRTVPTRVQGLPPVRDFSTGGAHTLAVDADGHLWAWGSNQSGVLGLGSTTADEYLTPQAVGTDADWRHVRSGFASLALKNNGSLWAWGLNRYGSVGTDTPEQCPDSTNPCVSYPLPVGSDLDWEALSAGGASLALKRNGTLWAWGENSLGALGLGDLDNRFAPEALLGAGPWKEIHVHAHVVALHADGSVWTWGRDSGGGELGREGPATCASWMCDPTPGVVNF